MNGSFIKLLRLAGDSTCGRRLQEQMKHGMCGNGTVLCHVQALQILPVPLSLCRFLTYVDSGSCSPVTRKNGFICSVDLSDVSDSGLFLKILWSSSTKPLPHPTVLDDCFSPTLPKAPRHRRIVWLSPIEAANNRPASMFRRAHD